MKRNERTTINQLRQTITANTINVEIPETWTTEGRQAAHELLTIYHGFYATRIYWNDFEKCYATHYEPANDDEAREIRQAQEVLPIELIEATLTREPRTWYGFQPETI